MYGLGAGGATGLSDILDLTGNEASAIMGLLGHTDIESIDRNSLASSHEHLSLRTVNRSIAE